MVKISKKKAEKLYDDYLRQIEDKYGNKETDTLQLNKMGKGLFGNKYIGTFPSDKIPIMKGGEYAIVNLDDSSKMGSHWVGLVKDHNNLSYVYDSFGRKTTKIIPALIQSGNGIIKMTENDAEQDKLEENCGQRCISALMVYNKYGWAGLKWI